MTHSSDHLGRLLHAAISTVHPLTPWDEMPEGARASMDLYATRLMASALGPLSRAISDAGSALTGTPPKGWDEATDVERVRMLVRDIEVARDMFAGETRRGERVAVESAAAMVKAIEEEREACAAICDRAAKAPTMGDALYCAEAIRERGVADDHRR